MRPRSPGSNADLERSDAEPGSPASSRIDPESTAPAAESEVTGDTTDGDAGSADGDAPVAFDLVARCRPACVRPARSVSV